MSRLKAFYSPRVASVAAAVCLLPLAARAQTPPDATGSPPPPTTTADERIHLMEVRLQSLETQLAARPPATPHEAVPPPPPPDTTAPAAPNLDYGPAVVPFAWGDFSWAPAGYAPADSPLHSGAFTGEVRLDVPFHYSFANPIDNTISGSSEVFRANEFQVTQAGFGGDIYYKGAQIRLMTQFGMYSQTTPRNDASPSHGQWDLADAYRYISEAYAGYHLNVLSGINIQAGIFMSYIGLWSYYNFDNWTYQPSYVSSNTPWFFNGVRIQVYTSDRLKIEPWLVNGWQSYGEFNQAPGVGLQIRWNPSESVSVLGNQYYGTDTLGTPGRMRIHTDDSVMVRLYNNPSATLDRVAVSLTVDAGCEFGSGVNAVTASSNLPQVNCTDQYFLGFMAYARVWFNHDMFAFTGGGGAITNPGRYLVLLPPINGATASTGSPYFTENKGDPYNAWDMQTTFDFMPTRNVTFRLEYTHRAASVPYFSGHLGVTPPGGNTGTPATVVPGWTPDLVPTEDRMTVAMMVRI